MFCGASRLNLEAFLLFVLACSLVGIGQAVMGKAVRFFYPNHSFPARGPPLWFLFFSPNLSFSSAVDYLLALPCAICLFLGFVGSACMFSGQARFFNISSFIDQKKKRSNTGF